MRYRGTEQLKLNEDHCLSSYHYDLPKELIAQRPLPQREQSRLLVYNARTGAVQHAHFHQVPELLPPEALLVFNRSKVFPCRLEGIGCEILLLSLKEENDSWRCLVRAGKKKRIGKTYSLNSGAQARIEGINGDGTFQVSFPPANHLPLEHAAVPIPPYIRNGQADEKDLQDYQTCYAREAGSVAAPTAGLHFEPQTLHALEAMGIDSAQVVLHIGPGTFAPVKTEDIREHTMHTEEYSIDQENWNKIVQARNDSKNIYAVGTTSLRVLESSLKQNFRPDTFHPTNLYLHPGVPVHSINGMITNFHRSRSSLLMLVSALLGREKTLELYSLAIEKKYRFFSYGDAMLITHLSRE